MTVLETLERLIGGKVNITSRAAGGAVYSEGPVSPKGNSRGQPQEFVVIIIVRLRHYQVKIIAVFGKLVALEVEVTEKDVPKLSLDDDT